MYQKNRRNIGLVAVLTGLLALIVIALSACTPQKEPIALEPSVLEKLEPVHPDEPAEATFNDRFSLRNGLESVDIIRGLFKPGPGETAMTFANRTGAIQGTLLKQDYLIKKAEFELAKYQHRDGDMTKADLDAKEAAYKKAVEDFTAFWESFGISD